MTQKASRSTILLVRDTPGHRAPAPTPPASAKVRPPVVLALTMLALLLAGCGASSASHTVARLPNSTLTESQLAHWMLTIVGGDYYEIVQQPAPPGLVAEPANYHQCITDLQTLATHTSKPQPPTSQLASKCQQLHQAIKLQTVAFLILSQQTQELAETHGIHITPQEINQRLQTQTTPKPNELTGYLNQRHWTQTDEEYLIKRNLIDTKLTQTLKTTDGNQLYTALINALTKRATQTTCKPNYITEGCQQYKPNTPPTTPSSAILIEQIEGI